MPTTELIQSHHLHRKAVSYIRQSTGHQVLTHTESHQLPHAMREHAHRRGGPEEHIEVVEADLGRSAQSTAGRDGYRALLAEVALGQVGIVLSYESTRLSRHCTDWYPLLELCAYHQGLIADREGVYGPSTPNGRLLLGMKGILSDVERQTWRGRLLAGVPQKAQRGDLALALPVGRLRHEDGRVGKDPEVAVPHALLRGFQTFLARPSGSPVVRLLREQGLRLPRRHRHGETLWRTPTVAAVIAILRNPAYTGTFVYGNTGPQPQPGRPRPRQHRLSPAAWKVMVPNRYPAYITWEPFERIQAIVAANYAAYEPNRRRGVPRQGLVACGICGHKMGGPYTGGHQYLCTYLRAQTQAPVCQRLPADPVDQQVVAAFFQALAPAALDRYEQALQRRQQCQAEVDRAHHYAVQRLRYEAELARRRYERVDPENRLVADDLERRWEAALQALHEAEDHNKRRPQVHTMVPLSIMDAARGLHRAGNVPADGVAPRCLEPGSAEGAVAVPHRQSGPASCDPRYDSDPHWVAWWGRQ